MSVPRRWLDDGGSATPSEREILRSALSVEPPPGAHGEVWAALLTKLPPPANPVGNGSSGGGPAATAGKAAVAAKAAGTVAIGGSVLKASLVGAGAVLALVTGYVGGSALRHPSTNTTPPAVTAPAHAQPTPAARLANQPNPQGPAANKPPPALEGATEGTLPAPAPLTERRASVTTGVMTGVTTGPQVAPSAGAEQAQRPVPNAADPGAERETMLQEESRETREAREALRRGDAAGALGMLEQIRARHPGGVLVQEREALTIEALARSGRRAEASARAAAFLKAYPTSTLAEHVQAFATMGETPKPPPQAPAQ